MRIQRLELKNIGCFSRADFEFGDATLIFGENRTGKSTLVYALFFALFGRHLNGGLTLKDLCTKGEPSGGACLFFNEEGSEYRLHQATDRLPNLHEKSNSESEWRPMRVTDSEDLRGLIPLAPETAALTAFFRESELIYFLQDIPKYNKTLLQSLIGMDDILILKSRFQKALGKAREYRKGVSKVAPPHRPDTLEIELTKRQLDKAETSLREIEAAYQTTPRSTAESPAVARLLEQQYAEKQKHLQEIQRRQAAYPEAAELERKKEALEGRLSAGEPLRRSADALQQRIGSLIREADQIRTRKEKLTRLEDHSACPLCEQTLPADKLAEMTAEMENRSAAIDKDLRLLERKLEKTREKEKEIESLKTAVQEIDRQIRDVKDLEARTAELKAQLKGLASDLSAFKGRDSNADTDADTNTLAERPFPESRPQQLETRRRQSQEAIIHNKVLLRQYEERIKRNKEHRKNLDIAERNVRVCAAAYQALEEAVQMLGSRMLERVRQSIETWSRHFTFLHRFDIQMTDRELLPIIQAKGYHYKLNQMSKSERIFLYLMLKLAIGEAMGHLGLFILDDPADGLDHKRKQTLAYLLAEVAKKRQVIVTTNDPVFADLFPKAWRINL